MMATANIFKDEAAQGEPDEIPSSLTFISEHGTDDECISTTHRANGDVLVGCRDGLKLLCKDTRQLAKLDVPYQRVFGVIEHHQTVYVLHQLDQRWKVSKCLPDFTNPIELFEFGHPNDNPLMTVSDQHIVVWYVEGESDTKNHIIYDVISERCETKLHSGLICPYLLPDSTLLASGNHQLTKYNINDGQLTPIWTCEELPNIHTVCANVNGLIYASTYNYQQSIYIISSDGKKLKELHRDKLPGAFAGVVSVRGDELMVPDWDECENKLYIFKLNY